MARKLSIENNDCYTNQFLKPEGTAQDFFNAISYPVELSSKYNIYNDNELGLYKIKKTCYFHQGFDFCPILIEINDNELQKHYDAKFLLQIWNKQSEKVFEKNLKFEIKGWGVYSDHFIYKLDHNEVGSEWIYIINLRKNNEITRVKDFLFDDPSFIHLGIIKDLFFYANSNLIHIIDIRKDSTELIKREKNESETKEDSPNKEDTPKDTTPRKEDKESSYDVDVDLTPELKTSYEIDKHCKLQGFYENQYCKSGEERSHYIICLVETEDNQIDFARLYFWSRSIKKKDMSFYQYTEVVNRDVKLDPIQKYVYICHSTQFLFGAAIRKSGHVDIYWNCKIVQTTAEQYADVAINFQYIYLKRKDGTYLRIDTKYDIRVGVDVGENFESTEDQWNDIFYGVLMENCRLFTSYALINTSFFVAHQNIISLFDIVSKTWMKHFIVTKDVLKVFRNEKDDINFNLGIYTAGGGIEIIDSVDTSDTGNWKKQSNSYKTSGEIRQMVSDKEDYRMLYMITNDKGTTNLYGFSRQTLYIYNTLVHELKETTRVLPYFSPATRTQFILFNKKEGEARIYTHYWANNKDKVLTFYLTKVGEPIKIKDSDKTITGTVHTAFTPDQGKYLFLVDNKNLYKIAKPSGEITVFKDQNIEDLQFIDNQFIYVMTNQSAKRDYGFYLYDINTFIDQNQDKSQKLDNALVGVNGYLDYARDNQRMIYMTDYNTIQIVPTLHRNCINFMGMLQRNQYLTGKRYKDKFMALDKKSCITTWNILTGKLESQYQLEGVDFSLYDIYSYEDLDITYKREWYAPKCLIMKKTPETSWNDKKFYDPEMLRTSLTNNTPYISIEQKKFHQFKFIEIIDHKSIKEHFSFIHPFYGIGKYQRLNISNDHQYMLERLVNQRVLLYQRIEGTEKLKMIKRLSRFPMDMSENTYANYLFSPDMMYYFDFDMISSTFVIKDTLTQTTRYNIPSGLLNLKDEEVKLTAKRFRWLDSERIIMVNKEGIEKIIDLKNNFQEISYCNVLNFKTTFPAGSRHYYFHQNSLSLGDTTLRLLKKHQAYKSAKYVHQKKEDIDLYNVLFDVDFTTDNSKYKYVADLSFSFLSWKLLDQLKNEGNDFNLDQIDTNQLKQLTLNIFPNCNTFLHTIYNKQNFIKDLYAISKIEGQEFLIPFIENIQGKSPLHLCMENNEFKAADIFFQNLKNTPIDHHGRSIASIIPLALKEGIPSIGAYLDSRLIQTEQIQQLKRGSLNSQGDLNNAYTVGHFWSNIKDVQDRLYKKSNFEQDVNIEFLDVPYLHCFDNKDGEAFFEELSNVGVEGLALFDQKAIQHLIEFKWPLVKEYTIKKLMLPFFLYQFTFFCYSNFIFGTNRNDEDGTFAFENYICALILIPISLYTLYQEFKQALIVGPSYFFQIWNYLDTLPPIMIIILITIDLFATSTDFEFTRTFLSITSFLLWIKFLYFLRIFKKTGYLVRMILQVMADMWSFLFVLMLVIIAFSDAFTSLSQDQDADKAFAGSSFFESFTWTFQLSLGEFDVDSVNNNSQAITIWIFFFACVVINVIVMLNLLIAIISESFRIINSNSTQAFFQERASLIAENSYLIPQQKIQELANENVYLMIGSLKVEEQTDDKWALDFQEIKILLKENNIKLNLLLDHNNIEKPLSISPRKLQLSKYNSTT